MQKKKLNKCNLFYRFLIPQAAQATKVISEQILKNLPESKDAKSNGT